MKLSYIYSSHTGLRRNTNEDFVDVFEVEEGLLAVVCDGLGGNNAGEVASHLAVTTIYSSFIENGGIDNLGRIDKSIQDANSAITIAAEGNPEHKGMATTAVVLFINQNEAYWGHVGDSRLYYWDDDRIEQVTTDHSFVQKLLDDGYISAQDAETHPHKNVIMRALGDKPVVAVDCEVFGFDSTKNWKFLLCTDGVSNVIKKSEFFMLLKLDDLETISKSLCAMIDERGAPDNYSYVIISNQV